MGQLRNLSHKLYKTLHSSSINWDTIPCLINFQKAFCATVEGRLILRPS